MRRPAAAAGVGVAAVGVGALSLVLLGGGWSGSGSGAGTEPGASGHVSSAALTATVTPAPVVEPAARRLLDRASSMPTTTAYSGVEFVSTWATGGTTSVVVDVEHTPGRGTTVTASGVGSGAPRSMTVRAAGVSASSGNAVSLLAAHYSLAVSGVEEVAGRPAEVVTARRPASGSPVVAKLWIDQESGLVLRREVYDDQGRTTRASAFIQVVVGSGSDGARGHAGDAATTSLGSVQPAQPWDAVIGAAELRRMRAAGWVSPAALPGPLTLVDARRGGADNDVVHLTYSDGLATVSVFQEPGRLDLDSASSSAGDSGFRAIEISGHQVWVRGTVPQHVTWTSGSLVFTVVADGPERTVERVVGALPHQPADGGGAFGRLDRGLDRVASWFNPFS